MTRLFILLLCFRASAAPLKGITAESVPLEAPTVCDYDHCSKDLTIMDYRGPERKWFIRTPQVANKATAYGPYPVEWAFDIDKPIRLKLKCEWVVEAK